MKDNNKFLNSGSFQEKDEYAKNNGELKPKIHICPVCGRRCEWYTVNEINPNAPCSYKCQLKMRENERK